MKIGLIADPLDTQSAGIYVYVKELLNSLHQLDVENQYTVIRSVRTSEYPKWNQHIIPINNKIPNHLRFRQLLSIPQYLNHNKYDIVVEFSHFGPFNLDKSIKRVTIIHDITPLLMPQYHTIASVIVQKMIMRSVLKKADLVIANSEHTLKDLLTYESSIEPKLEVISPGVSKQIKRTNDSSSLSEIGINAPFFLHVGTIEPRKNIEFLISAYERVAKTDEKVLLVLVGKNGWKSQYILDIITKSDFKERIVLTGYVSTHILSCLYTACRAMIYPTHYEGFGIPILEALNCGALVLLSKNSSLTEVAGEAGLYFNTIDELLELMRQTSNEDLKTAKWKEATSFQLNKYTWQNAAKRFINRIQQLGIS